MKLYNARKKGVFRASNENEKWKHDAQTQVAPGPNGPGPSQTLFSGLFLRGMKICDLESSTQHGNRHQNCRTKFC